MRKYSAAVGIIILLFVLIINLPLFSRFTISNGKTGETVFIDDIKDIEEFYISFRHSVNRTPVNEFYKIKNNKFIVYKTTFYSYGAGMPEYEPESKQKITVVNGLVQIENINRELEYFTTMVGTYADHQLNYKGKSLRLACYIEPQNPAEFRIKRVSALEIMRVGIDRKK